MSKKNRTRYAITGATGLLGSNLLFEIIKRNMNDLDALEVIILGRGKDNLAIEQRIKELFLREGLTYLGVSEKELKSKNLFLKNTIRCVHLDLDQDDLSLTSDDYAVLKGEPIDILFHVAALTDFRSSEETINSLRKTNVCGTENILKLVSALDIKQFCYVGSAYSCGKEKGEISPDFVNLKQNFRNPYEATKLEAEMLVRIFSKESGVPCKYFRASTICGRLIEDVPGQINKFDVFYAWAAFFLRAKLKHVNNNVGIYDRPVRMDVRVQYNQRSGLNVVPADYAAKVMYLISTQVEGSGSYYLVNDAETLHREYIPIMFETLNIQGFTHVDDIPKDMNRLETLYYKTVGKIYTPYITSDPMLFDVKNLGPILSVEGLSCPEVNGDNFKALMAYARENNFGISKKTHGAKEPLEVAGR